ncbi:transposase family protein [Moorena sp. SIO4G3]|uniref:transposase family protein n=1 Tax=Moorena sp. SIO4G3 TaxID=2607821 RepID=UPI00343D63DD
MNFQLLGLQFQVSESTANSTFNYWQSLLLRSSTSFFVLMQSLMGETTAVAHGGNPQDRTASPRPRCIATRTSKKVRRRVGDNSGSFD